MHLDLPLVDRFGAETPELKDNPIVHQYFGIITSRWGYIVDDVSLCVDVNEGGLSLDGFTMVHSKSQRKKLHGNKKKMVVDSYPQVRRFLIQDSFIFYICILFSLDGRIFY